MRAECRYASRLNFDSSPTENNEVTTSPALIALAFIRPHGYVAISVYCLPHHV